MIYITRSTYVYFWLDRLPVVGKRYDVPSSNVLFADKNNGRIYSCAVDRSDPTRNVTDFILKDGHFTITDLEIDPQTQIPTKIGLRGEVTFGEYSNLKFLRNMTIKGYMLRPVEHDSEVVKEALSYLHRWYLQASPECREYGIQN